MSDPLVALVEPDEDQPKLGTTSDPTLTPSEKMFFGLYFGTRIPSGTTIINDTRSMPKGARALWKLIVQFEERKPSMDGLYNLVKFGGAPLAEDLGDETFIHDDPRNAVHKPAMYDEYVKNVLLLRASYPFHSFIIDDRQIRRFVYHKYYRYNLEGKGGEGTITVKKSGFDIMGGTVNIILTHSGSGKSTYIKSGAPFIDGDTFLAWPKDPSWVDSVSMIKQVNFGLWQQLAEKAVGQVILYSGDVYSIPASIRSKFNFLALVEVPMADVNRNLETRMLERSTELIGWKLICGSGTELRKFSIDNGVPIFNGFPSMRAYISRLSLKLVSEAVGSGRTSLNIPPTLLHLIGHRGRIMLLDKSPPTLSFGSHLSMRIHTNEYARFSGLSQHRWKHLTRNYPLYIVMVTLGYNPVIVLTVCKHIRSVLFKGDEISASGHMLGAFTWLAFPHSRMGGMPSVYPDFHTYISMYLLNQRQVTGSLEPYAPQVAYHRWIETLAGVLGSYVAIKIILKKGGMMRRRDAILWRLYARRVIRSIRITDRTEFYGVVYDRDNDKRFGPI